MASTPFRPLSGAASHALRPVRIGRATFASSSRIGLDFTLPRRDAKTTTTTVLDVPPHASQPQPQSQSPATPPSSPAPSTISREAPPHASAPALAPRTAPLITPTFNIPTPSSPTAPLPSPTTSTTPLHQAKQVRRDKNAPKVARYDPESPPSRGGRAPTHTLHVKSTRNNVHLAFTDRLGKLFTAISGGTDKLFKKSNRSSHEAAHQAALKAFEKIAEYARTQPKVNLRVAFKGLQGPGREAVAQAIASPAGKEIKDMVVVLEDRTPIKIGGARAPKPRRT